MLFSGSKMKHRARFQIVLNTSLLILLSVQGGFGQSKIVHQITLSAGMTWCDDTTINGLLTQINAYRAQNGVPALAADSVGMKDAEIRATQFATYMASNTP